MNSLHYGGLTKARADMLYGGKAEIGMMIMYAAQEGAAPTGWLECDGAAVSRTTEAALFAKIGTTFGNGNGTTTFNVPSFTNRVPIGAGQGTGLTNRVLGTNGGSPDFMLTTSHMPQHTHVVDDPTHSHTIDVSGTGDHSHTIDEWDGFSTVNIDPSGTTHTLYTGSSSTSTSSPNLNTSPTAPSTTTGVTCDNAGNDQPHENRMPFTVMRYLICKDNNAYIPCGAVLLNASGSTPDGWGICSGHERSRSDYAALFGLLGIAFGSGDESTTFNVPSLGGRVVYGWDNGTTTVGEQGGEEAVTLVEGELPSHSHGVTDPGHSHSVSFMEDSHSHIYNEPDSTTVQSDAGTGETALADSTGTNTVGAQSGIGISDQSATTGLTTQTAGSNESHNNMHPYIVFNFIIKLH